MKKIIKADEPFERIVEPRDKALQVCRDMQQQYKVEHIEEGLQEHETVSFYRQGEFLDLCRGPHVPAAGAIGAFKLLSIAGAYWKGDASRQQLQRLYGTAFFNKQDLEAHLEMVEEAKKRDHRVLGKRLELFTISPLVGSGLVLWQPKGAIIRGLLENFIKEELQRRGYLPVYTPNIGRIELYKTSGHYPYYMESMFTPIVMEDDEQYLLKPMNCPHHIMIYKSKPRSYRDLPLRLAEFGTVYRYEQSGELSGHDSRARVHSGRRAHLLHPRAGGRRVPRLHRNDPVRARLPRPEGLPRATGVSRPDERQVRGRRGELGAGRASADRGLRQPGDRGARSSRAKRLFTVPRPTSSSRTASAASGNWAPCSWTTTCPARSGSTWSTSAPTTVRTARR